MRLNQECVRDVILYIESETKPCTSLSLNDFYRPIDGEYIINKRLQKYDQETLEYTLMKLAETKYIDGDPSLTGENHLIGYTIRALSWNGHKFADTIRDPKIWKNTKKVLSHLESVSITFLSNVASKVLENYIDKHIGW